MSTSQKDTFKASNQIVDQLLVFNIGTKSEIINAIENVVNKNDINEITDYIKTHQNDEIPTESKQIETLDNVDEKEKEKFPVSVIIRMRPLVGLEISDNHESVKYIVRKAKKKKTSSLRLKNVSGKNNDRDKKYTNFSHIIEPKLGNIETFNKCLLPTCVPYIFNGEKVCVFAYGHTGSGKTHTIFGYNKIPGMHQLFARNLFNDKRITNRDDIFIEIRFVELYQGKVYDLLSKNKNECKIREDINGIIHIRTEPKRGNDGRIRAFPINGITVKTEEKLLNIINDGIKSRNVGHSTLHDKSSRSHAFLEFEIVSTQLIEKRKKLVELDADLLLHRLILDAPYEKTMIRKYKKRELIPKAQLILLDAVKENNISRDIDYLEGVIKELEKKQTEIKKQIDEIVNNKNTTDSFIGGTMVFVDLAGNEYGRDVKTSNVQEERERNEINKSLLSLKECIRGLHSNKKHVGYRNSKLTMYLRKYLKGTNSKAIMIANIGTSQKYAKQSINTLQYSQLVAKA